METVSVMIPEEELLALPYGEYLEPLGYVAIATMVVFFILIVTAFRKISQWSRNEELQESIVTRSNLARKKQKSDSAHCRTWKPGGFACA